MTWEELTEKAKELDNVGIITDYGTYILICQQGNYYIKFSENGEISVLMTYLLQKIELQTRCIK